MLDGAGFPARATAPATEAVRLLRDLAADHPDAYLPGLAAALVVLSRTTPPTPSTPPPRPSPSTPDS
ncbi:hypothetical protein ACFQV2_20620 [Actinokineospora soli]|uniref:Tetracycline repressor TetR C-terminal domain-containing protein n=1 Tax=Actinokineospora soli TaxID=1048753 RepID=A0ABW2TP35_9PSEU